MGKKGKGNKLAKMSEEERARYLQMRADVEEEARRRKIQLLSLYMKHKLKREDAFCRLNMAKINQEWRSILRQAKCRELRKEMLEVERFFKQALEHKDRVKARLLSDLDVAEDMHATMQQSHMEIVTKMIGIQQQRVASFKLAYEQEKAAVLQECREDFEDYRRMRESAQQQLECVLYQLEDRAAKQLAQNNERYLERVDDVKSAMELRLEQITRSGEAKLERLWQEYQDVLSGYVRHTEGFYAEYVALKERDEENTTAIRDQRHEIERASDQLAHLKLVASDADEKVDVQVGYLLKVRDELHARWSKLKCQVDKEIGDGAQKFTLLSVESHNALKSLQSVVRQGETLLQLATVCRKFETEREQLAPLGLPPLTRHMLQHTEQDLRQTPQALQDHCVGHWRLMENFWRRVNNAYIDVVSLRQHKKSLEQENAQLKRQLQDYLVHLNLSSGSNLHIKDYLAKRPQSMCVERVRRIAPSERKLHSAGAGAVSRAPVPRPITTYVEANFTSAVRSQQLARGKPKLAKIVNC